ncbi:HAD family hydrolase [Streptomyces tsukubensis]|uniref:Hydrolase n=2 Tax=Streptomyces TaxID=1883 RepID=A0A1V3ZZV4_9ACTN|nr:HAD family phosphatase [Streptomyces tsukubensis]OON72040.1 hydrolase [Streptomyces tsukubensis]QFR93258.1 HAD-IA family hydrolase [Streptomyces tsukubensis]CBY83970.1 putative hydrolase [Streptomyces tacrolimicus]
MTTKAHPLLTWTPEAVVFDCDGTLMDTERHWQDARRRVFLDFGLTPLPGFAERAKGVHYTDCGRLMAEEAQKPELADSMAEELLTHFMARVAEDPVTVPGAAEFVRLVSGRLPLAVASNCPMETVESSLGHAGLLGHFAHIVVPSDTRTAEADENSDEEAPWVVRPKPWPDVYATAARLCGVLPDQALGIEDSLTGVESARRAGLRVLGVGPRPGEREAARADLWVTSLDTPVLLAWVRARVPERAELDLRE